MVYVILFILILALLLILPMLLLRPFFLLVDQHKQPKIRARFMISDLLSLMFLVQLPFAMFNLIPDRVGQTPTAVNVVFGIIALITWYAGLRAANHIGIDNQFKRIVSVGLTMPAAITSGFVSLFVLSHFVEEATPMGGVWGFCLVAFLLLTFLSAAWAVRGSQMWVDQHGRIQLDE